MVGSLTSRPSVARSRSCDTLVICLARIQASASLSSGSVSACGSGSGSGSDPACPEIISPYLQLHTYVL